MRTRTITSLRLTEADRAACDHDHTRLARRAREPSLWDTTTQIVECLDCGARWVE